MLNTEGFSLGPSLAHESMRLVGFSDKATTLASVAVRIGARRALESYGRPIDELAVEWKKNDADTPASIADRRSEAAMIRLIRHAFPHATIQTEEKGLLSGDNIIVRQDPLDGTIPFLRQEPYSTVGMAIERDGQVQSAAICQPFTGELMVAERGKGVWLFPLNDELVIRGNGRVVKVTSRDTLEKGTVYVDALLNNKTTQRKLELIRALQERLTQGNLYPRMVGSNIFQQMQVAAGRAEASITDCVGGPFDLMIGGFCIQEAGGTFTDLNGNPVTDKTQFAVGSNGQLHDQLLRVAQEFYNDFQGFR